MHGALQIFIENGVFKNLRDADFCCGARAIKSTGFLRKPRLSQELRSLSLRSPLTASLEVRSRFVLNEILSVLLNAFLVDRPARD